MNENTKTLLGFLGLLTLLGFLVYEVAEYHANKNAAFADMQIVVPKINCVCASTGYTIEQAQPQ